MKENRQVLWRETSNSNSILTALALENKPMAFSRGRWLKRRKFQRVRRTKSSQSIREISRSMSQEKPNTKCRHSSLLISMGMETLGQTFSDLLMFLPVVSESHQWVEATKEVTKLDKLCISSNHCKLLLIQRLLLTTLE